VLPSTQATRSEHAHGLIDENRADLHRVWHNSHYHQVGMTWLQYYRTGSRDLLTWSDNEVAEKNCSARLNWDLYVGQGEQEEKLLTFTCGVKEDTVWKGKDVELSFRVRKQDEWGDVSGVMCLSLPASRTSPGIPLLLTVRPQETDVKAYYLAAFDPDMIEEEFGEETAPGAAPVEPMAPAPAKTSNTCQGGLPRRNSAAAKVGLQPTKSEGQERSGQQSFSPTWLTLSSDVHSATGPAPAFQRDGVSERGDACRMSSYSP
jgi:hypothetical protein